MWSELRSTFERVSAEPGVRVVVLSSSLDKTWTVGLDLTAQTALVAPAPDPARKAFQLRDHLLDFQDAISSIQRCKQPVIAAIHGNAVGLAIDISSACDVRLAASDVTFGIFEVNVGLAADIGTLQRLPKIAGNESLVRELALTGRKFGADEAKSLGFVSEVVQGGRKEVLGKALDMAGVIAAKSPVAVVGTKHLLNRGLGIYGGVERDTSIAMKATLAKTRPSFPPLERYDGPSKAKL
ncbi:hypothetical protein JCM24511_02995 [Saitozyma sp. JCM 24511]|nr:hypothetical protein JCM24511_02995 [Saitozyma sp. JCM 24511]